MWRDSESSSTDEFVHSPHGLFPKPMSQTEISSVEGKKVVHLFYILGKFVAKALLDFRTIDLPVSPIFTKWVIGQESSLTIRDLAVCFVVIVFLAFFASNPPTFSTGFGRHLGQVGP